MAILKDLIVNGASRFIGDIFGTNATLSGNVIPETDNTQSLGDSTHRWKLYGIITGSLDKTFKIKLNNTQYTYDGSANVDLSTIYAPTAGGTTNQILVSAGSTSAPTWKATANGAAYATAANGALTFGTLPTGQGGTGNTSYTANRLIYSESATKLSSSSIISDGTNITTTGKVRTGYIEVDNGNVTLDSGGLWDTDYIIEFGSTHKFYGNADTATKWASAQNVYVTLGTASTTTTLQGGSSSAQTIGVNGTLNVANGGTGATTFTSGALLIGNGTNAVGTRSITNNTTNTAITNNTNIPTMNTIYYGLVTVNNASQTRATGIYAPTSAGNTANQILISAGDNSAPTWLAYADNANSLLKSGSSSNSPSWIQYSTVASTDTIVQRNNHGDIEANTFTIYGNNHLWWLGNNGIWEDAPSDWWVIELGSPHKFYGNATTATTLQTARTINGTSFNGSANITTTNWGTARNISISDSDATNTGTAVSVNGSAAVTLKLPATIKATLSGNADTATAANIATTTANALTYYTNTTGTFGDSAITIDTTSKHIGGFINGGQKSGTTLGAQATAEGKDTTASGDYSHAEGFNTAASDNYSHAEGRDTIASGAFAHAEGHGTTAAGDNSHAEGKGTIANKRAQHVFGEYNIAESGTPAQKGTYIEIVGNGTAAIDGTNAVRSNARTLDWDGNEWLAGTLTTSKFIHPAIIGSGTAAVTSSPYKPALWRFNLDIATPAEGDIITIKIPVAGHANGVFISTDDGTTYYPVSVSGTAKLTTHFGANQVISLVFLTSGGTNAVYPVAGGTETTNITENHWCVLNYYNSDTNTIMRTYAHNTNNEFPLLAGSTTTSTTPLSHTSSYASAYGAIVATKNKRPTINLSTGKITVPGGVTADLTGTATNATNIYSSASTSKAYILGTTTASSANHATVYNASVYTSSSVLYGAAWNDYAEYRQTDSTEPGRCVREVGDDTLILSEKRLERGCEIISDTFGFAIGETENAKTPIAVTGRVLAYPYEDREEFATHIGYPVCSGPNGTVSIMTEEEEEKYPSRIIGFISAVPDYEEWGTGNVKVNGRVWIRIR